MLEILRTRLWAALFAILILSPFASGPAQAVAIERVKSPGGTGRGTLPCRILGSRGARTSPTPG